MELFKIHSLLMVLILLSGSWGRSSNKGEGEKGCPSRSEFSKMMLRKLEDVEKDILNAFRSVTEEIGDCEDAGKFICLILDEVAWFKQYFLSFELNP